MTTLGNATDENGGSADETSLPVKPPCGAADCFLQTGLRPSDYLVELVRSRGGRIAQGTVVTVSGWSPSTVSRRLSSLEEDGRIVRVRLGSRKFVYLPGARPDILKSAFDEPVGQKNASRPNGRTTAAQSQEFDVEQ